MLKGIDFNRKRSYIIDISNDVVANTRLDAMKKQNINYGSLAQRGIRKAWDKACVYENLSRKKKFRLVLYYAGKPFIDWITKEPFNIKEVKITISSAIGYHSEVSQSDRRVNKRLARHFVKNEAGEKLVTYRNGGVLFPKGA